MNQAIYKYIPYKDEDEVLFDYMIDDLKSRSYTYRAIAKGIGVSTKRLKNGIVFNKSEFKNMLAFYLKENSH